ncbi:hypothetical protein Sjap_018147 [Stephania japonica]|uniref:Uncharacterized protein n=1 Tax=Stephania japonica TaxID=461633 RepID=A0AAP0I7G3_9MAGN
MTNSLPLEDWLANDNKMEFKEMIFRRVKSIMEAVRSTNDLTLNHGTLLPKIKSSVRMH